MVTRSPTEKFGRSPSQLTSCFVVLAGDDTGDESHGDDAKPHECEEFSVSEVGTAGNGLQ